jgi:nitrate reductase alpha subunit
MLKIIITLLVLAPMGLAQSSSDGSFSVHHYKDAKFSFSPAQMREAESLYQSACAVVLHDFPSGSHEVHPRIDVIIGTERNEVHRAVKGEIWMAKWDPIVFAHGVVILAFDRVLTTDVVQQLTVRTVRYSNASVDVARLKQAR